MQKNKRSQTPKDVDRLFRDTSYRFGTAATPSFRQWPKPTRVKPERSPYPPSLPDRRRQHKRNHASPLGDGDGKNTS